MFSGSILYIIFIKNHFVLHHLSIFIKYSALAFTIAALLVTQIDPHLFISSSPKPACCSCCQAGASDSCPMCAKMCRDHSACSVFPMPCRQGQSVQATTAPDIAFIQYCEFSIGASVNVTSYPQHQNKLRCSLFAHTPFHPPEPVTKL